MEPVHSTNTAPRVDRDVAEKNGTPGFFRRFARSINHAYLASPTVGVKKHKPQSPTKATEPVLRTALRAQTRETPDKPRQTRLFRTGSLRSTASNRSPADKPPRQRTIPQPFQFRTDRIHEREQEKLRKKVEEEEKKRKDAREFHTDGMPDFDVMPVFYPRLGERKKTKPMNVAFFSDQRLEVRKQHDEKKKELEREHEERDRILAEEKKREEEEQMRALRQSLVHRPQPIPRAVFNPFEIKHDLTQITVPHTPISHADRRLQERRRRL